MADNKHVVRKYGGYGAEADGSYVAFDSRYPGKYTPGKDQGDSVGASKAAGVLNRQNKGNTVSANNMGVWRGVTPGYASNTHGQQAIQGLRDLMNMPQGSDVVIYDTEILGTTPFHRKSAANADFYTPTEIGFQHAKMINGKLEVQSKSLSMLLKPNEQVYERLNTAINDLASKKWSGLTEDMRRTLSDLTLYAGDTSKLFKEQYKDGRRIVSVQEQSRHLRPMNGTDLSGSDTIANMRQGLQNLMTWGTNPEDAILEMNAFMTGFQNTRFAGYNVYSFDQPMMLDYLNNGVGKMNPNSPANKALQTLKNQMAINQIDGLHAVRTLYRDPYERYGDRVTLERQKDVLLASNPSRYAHLETGQSHHALSDVHTTVAQLNMLLQDPHTSHVLRTGNRPGSTFAYFNDQTLQVGDRLFGVAGMNSNQAGEYDGIYRMKNGKFHSAYDMRPNPIYRNTSYTIQNFFDGINIDGKKMYGIHLYNEDDGLHHTIFRESEGALQSAIHQHLQYVGPQGTPISPAHGGLHANQNADRAMRRWNKMFSTEGGGGIQLANRMYDALNTVQTIENQNKDLLSEDYWKNKRGMSPSQAREQVKKAKRVLNKMKKRAVLQQSDKNTDEFYRDFSKMRGRLEGEKQWIKGAIDRIQTAMPASGPDDYGTFRAQSMVLAEFGKNMDAQFGINAAERHLHGGKALSLSIDGEHSYLNVTNADNVRGALYGQLYKGNISRPDLSIIKQRYKQLLLQLKSYNALEAKKFEQMWYALDNREYDQTAGKLVRKTEGVRKDISLDTMLTDISNAIIRAKETNSLHGALNGVTVESPTKVQDARAAAMKGVDFKSTFDSMFTKSLSDVQPYTTKWKEGSMELFGNDAMELVTAHDNAIKMLLQRNGFIDGKENQLVTGLNLQNIKSSRSSLAELAQAFSSNDMHVQIRYDGKRKGLQMVLADKGVSESLLNGSINDIMKSNQAAVIDLPRMMSNGSLTLGSQNRVARFKAQRKYGGEGYELVTGFDEIINTLKHNAGTVRTMLDDAKKMSANGRDDGMIMVHDYLNRKAKKAMMNLSMNNRYSTMGGHDNPWETKSQAANWVRGGLIDISDTAEEWYKSFYEETEYANPDRIKLWGLKTPEKVKELAAKNGELFVDSMGMQARRVFQRQSDDFFNKKTGMNVGMHSVKDVHVSNYLRANLDARELLAFGFYNPMGRENIMKTVNYNALDKDKVRYNLKKQGYTSEEIDRMMSRGVVSEGALDVMEEYNPEVNKISYLNMRAAYMNDEQLADRLTKGGIADKWATIYEQRAQQKGLNQAQIDKYLGYAKRLRGLESISTFDGMFLLSDKAAQAYGHTREKKIKLGPNEELTDEIKKLIMNQHKDGENVDFTKNITMDDWRKQDNGLIKNPKLLTNMGESFDTSHSYKNNGKSLTVSNVVQDDLIRDAQGQVIYDGLKARYGKVPVRVGQTYDKWYAGSTWIKGWDAENQELILEEQVQSMNSTKYISEAGHRATATLLPEEVIRDLAGDSAVKAIMPQFEVSKGMFGSELSRMVAMAADEAKRQIDNGGIVTVGKIAKEDALQTINQIMQDSFGIGSSLSYVKNGQIVVNKHIGSEQAHMAYTAENMNKFANAMDKYLGTDTFGGKKLDHASGIVHYGNLGIGKQDVYDWENGVGLVDENSSGLVRYGRKEVDMITERVNQVLGRGSAVTGWLKEHIDLASKAQSKDMAQIGRGLIKASVYTNPITPDAGDVVIRTSGNSFHSDDPNGISTGRITPEGVREISMHALNDVPTITAKNTVRTAEMYAQTIIDFGRAQGSFKDGVSFSQAIKKAGGTALLELPNSDAINRKYLRLVDFGDITKGDTAVIPVMRELQTIQQQLWRNIQEYNGMNSNGALSESEANNLRERLETRINDLSDQYEDKAARMVSNSRDGGLSKTLGAAKMDNAGRFRIQGVNPFANYEEVAGAGFVQPKNAKYQEGSMYVSRNRLQEMIGDAKGYANNTTMNIAKAMGLEKDIAKKGLNLSEHGEQIMKLVLDNVNDKGLYGFVNRYPTIKQSTVQSMRIQIDDSIDPTDRTGRLTVGTAARLKADYDGDFMSTVLSHYSTDADRAMIIHNELKSINTVEAREAHIKGQEVLAELHGDMGNVAKSMNITVGELAKKVNEAEMVRQNMRNGVEGASLDKDQKALLMKFGRQAADKGIMTKYMNAEDILETREARLGKEFVGLIDNARDRIVNLAGATLDELEAHGKISVNPGSKFKTAGAEMRNAIEDFGAAFSQDSISAKKFSVEDEIKRQFDLDDSLKFHNEGDMAEARSRAIKTVDERYNKLQDMIEAVMNPTNENKQTFMNHNVELQLFKGPEGEVKMKNALDAIQKIAIWNNRTGSYFNNSLKLSQSMGQGQERLSSVLMGMEHHVANTDSIQNLIEWSKDEHGNDTEVTTNLREGTNRWSKSLLSTFDRVENGGDQALMESLGRGFNPDDFSLSGSSVAEESKNGLANMIGKFAPKLEMGGSAGKGALAFGAMWAASALIRSGPTPEGLQKQTQASAPSAPPMDTNPTARITKNNGEYVNIQINAKNAKNLSEQDIAAAVHQELGAMTNTKLDTNINVNDNTQNIDPNWLQGVVAKAIGGGYAF